MGAATFAESNCCDGSCRATSCDWAVCKHGTLSSEERWVGQECSRVASSMFSGQLVRRRGSTGCPKVPLPPLSGPESRASVDVDSPHLSKPLLCAPIGELAKPGHGNVDEVSEGLLPMWLCPGGAPGSRKGCRALLSRFSLAGPSLAGAGAAGTLRTHFLSTIGWLSSLSSTSLGTMAKHFWLLLLLLLLLHWLSQVEEARDTARPLICMSGLLLFVGLVPAPAHGTAGTTTLLGNGPWAWGAFRLVVSRAVTPPPVKALPGRDLLPTRAKGAGHA